MSKTTFLIIGFLLAIILMGQIFFWTKMSNYLSEIKEQGNICEEWGVGIQMGRTGGYEVAADVMLQEFLEHGVMDFYARDSEIGKTSIYHFKLDHIQTVY